MSMDAAKASRCIGRTHPDSCGGGVDSGGAVRARRRLLMPSVATLAGTRAVVRNNVTKGGVDVHGRDQDAARGGRPRDVRRATATTSSKGEGTYARRRRDRRRPP